MREPRPRGIPPPPERDDGCSGDKGSGPTGGAPEALGASLVFAIPIAAVGVFQVTVVPRTNEEVEFKHSTGVRADVADLRAAMVSTGTDGGRRTVSVRTGVDYPSRSVTVSPPAPRGQLSTSGEVTGAIELQGISATDPEAADFWDGTATFDSRFVTYRPSYNYYGEAPVTRYEPTVVYSSFRDADVAETPQSLVDGRTIDVVLASGSLSRNGVATETVDVVPVSTSTRSVTVEDPGPLRVRTLLSPAVWNATMDKQPNADVVEYDDADGDPSTTNVIVISLASGEWDLRVSEVSLGSAGPDPAPAYVVAVGSASRQVDGGDTVEYGVRVLDEYGNPVNGVTVKRESGPSRTTDADGRVTFEGSFDADTTDPAWFGSKPASGSSPRRVDFDFTVTENDASQLINPGDGLVLQRVAYDSGDFTASLKNEASGTVELTGIRFTTYDPDTQNAQTGEIPARLLTNRTGSPLSLGGQFVSTEGINVASGDSIGIRFDAEAYDEDDDEYVGFEIGNSDSFMVTVSFADGTVRIYFIGGEYDFS